ncbi:hypothetical protein D3C83_105040 [compost metagenome]
MIDGLKRANPGEGIRHRHRIIAALLLVAVAAFWVGGDQLVSQKDAAAHFPRGGSAHRGNG